MILQYAEHLVVPVPAVLKPAISLLLKAMHNSCRFVCPPLKGRAVGAFEISAVVVP